MNELIKSKLIEFGMKETNNPLIPYSKEIYNNDGDLEPICSLSYSLEKDTPMFLIKNVKNVESDSVLTYVETNLPVVFFLTNICDKEILKTFSSLKKECHAIILFDNFSKENQCFKFLFILNITEKPFIILESDITDLEYFKSKTKELLNTGSALVNKSLFNKIFILFNDNTQNSFLKLLCVDFGLNKNTKEQISSFLDLFPIYF